MSHDHPHQPSHALQSRTVQVRLWGCLNCLAQLLVTHLAEYPGEMRC